MTYLYAGMGIAMLTAIMAMFEMANGLTGQQMFTRPPKDPYLQSSYQTYDKSFLKLVDLMDSTWTCKDIQDALNNNELFSDIKVYQQGLSSVSVHSRLIGSCVFNHDEHRVLIAPSPVGSLKSHQLFSCLLDNDVICDFERARG